MSGIAGIIHFDGKPVEPGLIEKMTSAMAHRGPDGIHHWVKGSVALGQCMLRTTPESLEETQPLTNEDESLVLVMDGRVDNWEELRRELLARGAVLRNRSDAELVLRAYETWGDEAADRIVGDFAFALRDERRQTLFCGRDVMGVRPLYFYCGDQFILVASEMHALFQDSRIPREPNLGMVAEYLAAQVVSRGETLFKGIQRLEPGHRLTARAGTVVTAPYWRPDFGWILHYRSEDDYVDHLIELMKCAIASRLRSTGPVGVRMSGGVDSTTVFGLARSMIAAGEVDVATETFSTVFPGEDCDESHYIQSMDALWGATANLVERWIAPPEHYSAHARFYLDCPDSPNGAMNTPLKDRVTDNGIRVLLTGAGGDEWFWGRDRLIADLIKGLRFMAASGLIWRDKGTLRQKTATLLRSGLMPLLPAGIDARLRRLRKRRLLFPWVTQELLRSSSLEDRIAASNAGGARFASFDQEAVYRTGTNGWMAVNAEIEDLTSARHGIEQRHPLWDRRIIEFALAIPGMLRWRPPYHKYILRQAARGFLPEALRLRQDKTSFDSIFPAAIKAQGGQKRMGALLLAAVGWVDGQEVERMTAKVLSAKSASPVAGWGGYIWPVWMAYAIDVWLRESGMVPHGDPFR